MQFPSPITGTTRNPNRAHVRSIFARRSSIGSSASTGARNRSSSLAVASLVGNASRSRADDARARAIAALGARATARAELPRGADDRRASNSPRASRPGDVDADDERRATRAPVARVRVVVRAHARLEVRRQG
jgi:hypothetical protein